MLATPLLDLLDLPPRIASFAYDEGLETIGDLARIAPDALLAERNLGRKSVHITRRILEERTGVTWEAIACPDRVQPSAPVEDPDPLGWDAVRKRLEDEHRRIPLVELDLPLGLRRTLVKRGISTLGDLSSRSRADLLQVPGIGRKTLKKLPGRVTVKLDTLAEEYRNADCPLFGAFLDAADELEVKRRFVVRARSGLEGHPMSFAEIGGQLDLCPERVRQLEKTATSALRERAWAIHAKRRVSLTLTDGPIPFPLISTDPWWASACDRPALVAFVVERVLEDPAYVVELDGAHWLSRHPRADLADTWAILARAAKRIEVSASELELDELLSLAVDRIGPCLHVIDRFRDRFFGGRPLPELP